LLGSRALVLLALCIQMPLLAQTPAEPSTAQDQAVRMFLDCQAYCGDYAFFRTELPWVNHVRDQRDADVHILVTAQPTAAGGQQFTLKFIGLRANQGHDAELLFNLEPNQTDDARRRGLLRLIQLGLVPYALHTPSFDQLELKYQPPKGVTPAASAAVHDPWNHWVIRTSINTNFNGESTSKRSSINGSISANRTTEAWKFIVSTNGNYSNQKFVLSEGDTFTTINRNTRVRGVAVKSLTPHWSAGARAAMSSDTYVNQRRAMFTEAAVEWDLFPYSESTRRQFTVQYMVGPRSYSYYQETIYGKMKETIASEQLTASLALSQPWGEANVDLYTANNIRDMSQYHVEIYGYSSFRIVRGLSIFVNGNASKVHDQLYLQRGEATDQEILVRQRQLATSYRYGVSMGLSYTFGSIFNNVVNSRFRND